MTPWYAQRGVLGAKVWTPIEGIAGPYTPHKQVHKAAVRSAISPIMANSFTEEFESYAIISITQIHPDYG